MIFTDYTSREAKDFTDIIFPHFKTDYLVKCAKAVDGYAEIYSNLQLAKLGLGGITREGALALEREYCIRVWNNINLDNTVSMDAISSVLNRCLKTRISKSSDEEHFNSACKTCTNAIYYGVADPVLIDHLDFLAECVLDTLRPSEHDAFFKRREKRFKEMEGAIGRYKTDRFYYKGGDIFA